MDKYQEALVRSMSSLADSIFKEQQGTGTYEGVIIEQINDESYYVQFRGDKIKCYTDHLDNHYNPGEVVLFLVPENDFSKHKTIIASTTPGSTKEPAKGSALIDISGNLIGRDKHPEDVRKLSSYKVDSNPEHGDPDPIILGATFTKLINQYIKTGFSNFALSADVYTLIPGENQILGNYGLRLQLQLENEYGDTFDRVIALDRDTISGNPYRQEDPNYTNQSVQIKLEDGLFVKGAKIVFFDENFPNHKDIITEDDYDIFLKNIKLCVLDNAPSSGTFVKITSKDGYYLYSDFEGGGASTVDNLLLVPQFTVAGEQVSLDTDGIDAIYWFEEDDRVTKDSPYFIPEGGSQWRCINQKDVNKDETTGEEEYIYNKNLKQIKVATMDYVGDADCYVFLKKKIKCVIIYRGNAVEDIVEVVNLDNLTENTMTLYTANGLQTFPEQIGNVNCICEIKFTSTSGSGDVVEERAPSSMNYITYVWTLYDRNMKLQSKNFYDTVRTNDFNNGSIFTEIKFPVHLIQDYAFVKVAAYFSATSDYGDILIGSCILPLSTSDNLQYVLGIENSEPLYKYDEDGDSPLTADLYDGPASSKITETKPFKVHLYNTNGIEIDESNYSENYMTVKWMIPKNSLIETVDGWDDKGDYYLATGRELKYTIAKKYNRTKNDNTITVKVEYDGNNLTQLVTVQFLKDQFSGIEGTKYSAFIVHDENSSNQGGEEYAYEQKDKNGLHKLKIYKIGSQYFYSNTPYEVNEKGEKRSVSLLPWNNNCAANYFRLRIFRDGEELIEDNPKIEWKMFGGLGTGFTIQGVSNTYRAKFSGNPTTISKNAIIQASYTTQAATAGSKSYKIYAYYPIEIIEITGTSVQGQNIKIHPTIDNGFYTVFYTSEGVSPTFDYVSNFKLNIGTTDTELDSKITTVFTDVNSSNNFDLKRQEQIKPAQKYNRQNLNSVLYKNFTLNSIWSELNTKLTKINSDLQQYAVRYSYTNTKTIWDNLESFLNNNLKDFRNNILLNKTNIDNLKTICNNFITSFIQTAAYDGDFHLDNLKEELTTIKNKINSCTNYDEINNNIVSSLLTLVHSYFDEEEDGWKIAKQVKSSYEIEENKYAKERFDLEEKKYFYENLKALGQNASIKCYKPVAFVYDTEMLAEIENYDGSQKISGLDTVNTGAGTINDSGQFSGLALGSDKTNGYLIGYCNGKKTFTLDRHGNMELLGGGEPGDCRGGSHHGGNLEVAGNSYIHGDTTIDGRFGLLSAGFAACNLNGWKPDIDDDDSEYGPDDGWDDERYENKYSSYGAYKRDSGSNYTYEGNVSDFFGNITGWMTGSSKYLSFETYDGKLHYVSQSHSPSINGSSIILDPAQSSSGKSSSKDSSNSGFGDGGSLFAIADENAEDYGYEDSVSGIGSGQEDIYGIWCGFKSPGQYSLMASNNRGNIDTFVQNNTGGGREGGGVGVYLHNVVIGGDDRSAWVAGVSEDGSALFANGKVIIQQDGATYFQGNKAYIDSNGNFVSPNLICGVANGSGSTPGLGLGYIGSNQGQLAVAGGSITACGNIPITITGEGGVWGGIKINSQNSLANPRLKVIKGEAAKKPVLYNGWIKINNQEIYINGPITLPPTQSNTIIKEGDFDGECGGNATDASIYYTYTISKGEGNTSASIVITCHRIQGTGSEPSCSCGCDETKSDYAEWYTWTGNEKVYWNYSNGIFSWNLDELNNPEKQGRYTDACHGDPCEEGE